MKLLALALLLALQAPPVTLTMNKEATLFTVTFPKDTVAQACIKFESQTERIVLDGVDQKYTPTSCVVFMDGMKTETEPGGARVEVVVGSPRTGYEEDFPLDELGPGEWHVWAETQVAGTDTWLTSNVITHIAPITRGNSRFDP